MNKGIERAGATTPRLCLLLPSYSRFSSEKSLTSPYTHSPSPDLLNVDVISPLTFTVK